MNFIINIIIIFLIFSNKLISQNYSIDSTKKTRKNNIDIKFGFTNGFRKVNELNYLHESEPKGSHDIYYDLDVAFPKIIYSTNLNISYNFLLNKKRNYNNDFYISLGVGYSNLQIKTNQSGIYYGGYALYYFKGNITDEKKFHTIDIPLGFSFEKTNINNQCFGIGMWAAPKLNFLTTQVYSQNNTLINIFNNGYTSYTDKITNTNFFSKYALKHYTIYELSVLVFASKKIKSVNYGIFVGYSLTNYSGHQTNYSIFDYSFFKAYDLIKYGLLIKI